MERFVLSHMRAKREALNQGLQKSWPFKVLSSIAAESS
jgi:hypothetical protein